MPAPTSEAVSTSAKQYFSSKGIELPMRWQSMGDIFPQAFQPPELHTPANSSECLFHEPTLNKYHTDTAYTLSRNYAIFIDGISAALTNAIEKWMKIASVVSVNVLGPVGTLLTGGVTGPELYPLIMADAPQDTESDFKYSRAIAAAVSDNWSAWQQGLTGILNFPGFTGAPTMNLPAPVMSLMSETEAGLAPHNLSGVMWRNLDDPGALHAQTLFESVANSFYTHFQVFKTSTLVTGVTVVAAPPPPPVDPAATEAASESLEADESGESESDETTNTESEDPADPETDPEADSDQPLDDPLEEETEPEDIGAEPEEAPPAAPALAGMVIPTPGNFV
jgi:hypothetical protein